MRVFANRLRELRKEKGLSTSALANLLQTSDTAICNWENGKHDIKGDMLIKIAKFFGVTADQLLGLDDY